MTDEEIRKKILDGTIYKTIPYRAWRMKVYRRDKHTCRMCGKKDTYFNAHHILTKYKNPKLIYNVDNGITLCVPCHRKVTGCEPEYADFFHQMVEVGIDKQVFLKPRKRRKKKKKASKKKRAKNLKRLFK